MHPSQNPGEDFRTPNQSLPSHSQLNSPREPRISFDAIPQAWTVLLSSSGTYVGATLLASLFVIIPHILVILTSERASQSINKTPPASPFIFLLPLCIVIFYILMSGILRMAIQHLKTGRAELGQVFSTFSLLPSLLLAALLVLLAFYAGLCLFIVPGFLISSLYMFVWPLIVDQHMKPIQAMKISYLALRPQMWMALLYAFVLYQLAQLGIIVCIIGIFFSTPLAIISLAITYRNFFPDGNNGFEFFPIQNPPKAPIADPHA